MVLDPASFELLMQQALAGDKRSYEALLRNSARLLRPYLSKHLTSNAETDDILQEILLSIHKAKHTYDGNRPYKPWLFAIAKFRLNDYFRKLYGNKFRHALDLSEVENSLAMPVTETGSSSELLEAGLKGLNDKQGQIISLMHVEGYTAKEVGTKLGMKESAVKVAAHRAYKILREKMRGKS